MIKKTFIGTMIGTVVLVCGTMIVLQKGTASAQDHLTPIEELGKFIFFDTNLSEPAGQACASCHAPDFGFTDPDQDLPVSEGVIAQQFGVRNSPSPGYAAFTPKFDAKKKQGGQFRDGRAADLIEQAKDHLITRLGMNNPDKQTVITKIKDSSYGFLYEQVFGADTFVNIDSVYHNIATAIAAYEGSEEVNPFTSKFDAYQAGLVELTPQEELGEILFSGKANCSHCHPVSASGSAPILFTDFSFHNIGVPRNTEYPFNLQDPVPIDPGLAGVTGMSGDKGKFKTPHLRNIQHTAPYMHNGYFKSLKEVVHFYNTRDIPGMWPDPEVRKNLDSNFIGDLSITDEEEDAIVAFMLTFTDGFIKSAVEKYKID